MNIKSAAFQSTLPTITSHSLHILSWVSWWWKGDVRESTKYFRSSSSAQWDRCIQSSSENENIMTRGVQKWKFEDVSKRWDDKVDQMKHKFRYFWACLRLTTTSLVRVHLRCGVKWSSPRTPCPPHPLHFHSFSPGPGRCCHMSFQPRGSRLTWACRPHKSFLEGRRREVRWWEDEKKWSDQNTKYKL